MSLLRYKTYSSSGVDWLGNVPDHWAILRIRYLASRISSGKTPLGGNETYTDSGVIFLRSQNIYDQGLRLDDVVYISDAVDTTMAVSRVQPNDILVNITGASLGRSCVVPNTFPHANVNQHVCVIRMIDESHVNFVGWCFKSAGTKAQIACTQNGAARDGLNFSQIADLRIAFPPKEEHGAIELFLNKETSKIDDLIAEQQRLIELLKEKRRAVISHAVTKGLNPDVPMKDSGVEWLGRVPKHWRISPLKYLAGFRSGSTPNKGKPEFWDGTIPWASAKDLKVDALDDTEDHITDAALEAGEASLIAPGSLLVVVRGMILARCFPVVRANVAMAINQDLKAINPIGGMSGDYMAWLLKGSELAILSNLDEAAHGTKALRMDRWGSMLLPVPPFEEQSEIAAYISKATASLIQLIKGTELACLLLQERRTALISAAVTGKIDVRGLVKAEPETEAAA